MKKNKELLKLFYVLLLILFLLAGTDLIFGKFMDKIYFTQGRTLLYGIEEAKEEVLIIGSSRALNHYVSSIVEDSLKMSCFNLGSGGQNIYYYYGIIKSALARYSPKLVILELTDIDYYYTPGWNTEKLTIFNPAYYNDTTLKEVVNLMGNMEKYKLRSSFYRFNGELPQTLTFAILHGNKCPVPKNDGYIPLKGECTSPLVAADRKGTEYDPNKIRFLRKFIGLCQDKGVKLILTTSPRFSNMQGDKRLLLTDLAKEYKIPYLNFEQNEYFLLHPEYFRDPLHLNDNGARIYTSMIIYNIKQYIKE